jgi:hypothetical protein
MTAQLESLLKDLALQGVDPSTRSFGQRRTIEVSVAPGPAAETEIPLFRDPSAARECLEAAQRQSLSRQSHQQGDGFFEGVIILHANDPEWCRQQLETSEVR